jgi:uncharacterized pyridoxamine 5'-phosphate oxidase family protein
MDAQHSSFPHHPSMYTKTQSDLKTLVMKQQWIELMKIAKDVIQTTAVKEEAQQCVFECLRNIADSNFHMVEKDRTNSTECSNRILSIITSRYFQTLNGREVILEYLGKRMIEMCTLDTECYYNLINIANNAEIKSNINLKALAAYYQVLFSEDGRLKDRFRIEIEYAVRHLNVRYINILLMTYDLDQESTDQVYLLLNHIRSKRD